MIIFSTGSLFNYDLRRVFTLVKETGYDGIEVLIDSRWDTRDPVCLQNLSSEFELPILALHSPFVPDIQGWPSDQLHRVKNTVKLAQRLAVKTVVTHLPLRYYGLSVEFFGLKKRRVIIPIPFLRRDPYYYFIKNGDLSGLTPTNDLAIAVENMPAHRLSGVPLNLFWFNRIEELTRFPHLTLDTTHLGTWGIDPGKAFRLLKKHVSHVHLSNYDGREHRLPTHGHIDLKKFLGLLRKEEYRGAISVETSPDALQADDEKECRDAMRKSLDFCREHL